MNMKLLSVVTPLSIHHDLSTWKTFWEEIFTGEENFKLGELIAANMKNCVFCNVRKHREIKDSDKYITLYISLNFCSLDKMGITSSDPKGNLGRLVKGLITSLGLKVKARITKYKIARYVIGNVSMKDLSKIIREFEKSSYKSYERRRLKHDPTDSYLYPARHIVQCMMRAYALNSDN